MFGGSKLKVVAVLIFALGFGSRSTLVLARKTYLEADKPSEVELIAWSLATAGTFSGAYGPGTGPTAHAAPLYPVVLSGVYGLFGRDGLGRLAQQLLSAAATAALFALLPWVSTGFGVPRTAGLLGGFGGALVPLNFRAETSGSFETAFGALAFAVAATVTARCWMDGRTSVQGTALAGLACGIALLTFPSALPPLVALFGLMVRRSRRSAGVWRLAAIQILVCAVILAPWAARNWLVFGKVIWTRSNLGLELSLSHNAKSAPDFVTNLGNGVFRAHPHADSDARMRLLTVGEARFHEERLQDALRWIRENPAQSVQLTLTRGRLFWFPSLGTHIQTLLAYMLTLGAALGLAWLVRSQVPAGAAMSLILLSYPLVYYLLQFSPRYRQGMDWALWLLSGVAVHALYTQIRGRSFPDFRVQGLRRNP